jgi:flagellar biosynthesis/type III secretory pathway protein FliH
MNDLAQWGTLITILGSIALQFYNSYKSNRRKDKQDEMLFQQRIATEKQDVKLEALHVATNGMSERLAAANLQRGEAEGHERGLKEGRAETKTTGDHR